MPDSKRDSNDSGGMARTLLPLLLGAAALDVTEGEEDGGGEGEALDGGGTAAAAFELGFKEPDAEEGLLLAGEAAGEGDAAADFGIVRDCEEERRLDGGEALGEPAGAPLDLSAAFGATPPLLPPVIAAACLAVCPVRGPTDSGFLLPSRLRREAAFACTGTGGWRASSRDAEEEEARLGGGEEDVLNAAEDCCAVVLVVAEAPTDSGVLDRRGGDAAGDEDAWGGAMTGAVAVVEVGVGETESGGVVAVEDAEEVGEQASPPGACAPVAAVGDGFHGTCNKLPPASLSYTTRPWQHEQYGKEEEAAISGKRNQRKKRENTERRKWIVAVVCWNRCPSRRVVR